MTVADDEGADLDRLGQAAVEGRDGAARPGDAAPGGAPEGPHATPSLTDPQATPGAGSLPDPASDDEAAAGTG